VSYDESDDLKYEVVWSANEDVTGVYQVLWTANTWWPEMRASERLARAEDAIRWALGHSLIDLYYEETGDARPLAPHEHDEALRAWQTWAIPDGAPLFFWRTDAGERWLKEKPVPRSWVQRSWLGVKEGTGDVDFPDLS
jgi:hypothetical protein